MKVRQHYIGVITDQEHTGVQTIRAWLADQFRCHHILVLRPAVLNSELAHPLRSSESGLEPCLSAIEIILRLVEHSVCFQDTQNSFLPSKNFFREQKLG